MAMAYGWMVYLLLLFHFGSSQIYPGSYELSNPAISQSGSSETGNCSDVSDSGRVCNAPRSSVLFDGITTLTGLEGDMWATQLLTLNTSTSSASITFDFTNPTDRNGPTNYAGVEVIEVVMFNCPARGIGAVSIGVNVADISFDNIAVSESCEYLVRACSNEVSTLTRQVNLNFMNQLQHVYLAEVTFYTTSRPCSPIGPINTSVITTPATTPDTIGEISSPVSSQSEPLMVSSPGTSVTGSPMSNSNAGVIAAVLIVILIITGVICMIVVSVMFYNKSKKKYNVQNEAEDTGDSNYTRNQYEETEVTAPITKDHKVSNNENENLTPNGHSASYEGRESIPNENSSTIKKDNSSNTTSYLGVPSLDSNTNNATQFESGTGSAVYTVDNELRSKSVCQSQDADIVTREGEPSTDRSTDFKPPPKPPRQKTKKDTSELVDVEVPLPVLEKLEELEKDLTIQGVPQKIDSTPTQEAVIKNNTSLDGNMEAHGEFQVPEEDELPDP